MKLPDAISMESFQQYLAEAFPEDSCVPCRFDAHATQRFPGTLGGWGLADTLWGIHLFLSCLLDLLVLLKVRHFQCDSGQFLAQHLPNWFLPAPRSSLHRKGRGLGDVVVHSEGTKLSQSTVCFPCRSFHSSQTQHDGGVYLPGGGPGRIHCRHWREREFVC